MRFARPTPRGGLQDRAIVPMINVVFLLLIFFLMTASLAPPAPLDLTLPGAEGTPAELRADTLYLAADGTLAYGTARGDAVWPALAARDGAAALALRADAGLAAADLARLLGRLAALGIDGVDLVAVPR